MGMLKLLSVALLALGAQAQETLNSAAYTDSKTGIDFHGIVEPNGFRAGIVLPPNPGSDFVGQIVSPLRRGGGWGGLVLGPGMVGHLLITIWPNGTEVASSFRSANEYAAPPPWKGNATLTPIANGTFVNTTHVSFTFVCHGCLRTDGFTFNPNEPSDTLARAIGYSSPVFPKDPNTRMTLHDAGTNLWNQNLNATRSSKYPTYAAMARA